MRKKLQIIFSLSATTSNLIVLCTGSK